MRSLVKILFLWALILFIGVMIFSVCYGRINVNENLKVSQTWFPKYSLGLFSKNDNLLGQDISLKQGKEVRTKIIIRKKLGVCFRKR